MAPSSEDASEEANINSNYQSGKINAADVILQDVGQAAKEVTDATVNSPISPLSFLPKAADWVASKVADPYYAGIGGVLRNVIGANNADKVGDAVVDATNAGKTIVEGAPGSTQNNIFQGLKKTYTSPQVAGDVGAAVNVATLAGTAAMAGESVPALAKVTTPTADDLATNEAIANIADQEKGIVAPAKTAAQTSTNSVQQTWDVIKPKLTQGDMADAAAAGRVVRTGETGVVTQVPIGKDLEDIKLAQPYVEAANGDPLQTAANIKQGIADEATQLRSAVEKTGGGTWSTSNVKGAVNDVKVPLAIKNTAEATQVENIKEFVADLADQQEKSAAGALDLSKAFREQINNEYGENIWNSPKPLGTYVRNVNQALNDFISTRLPDGTLSDGTLIKDSFAKQSNLYRILDNIQVPKIGDALINPEEDTPLKLPGSPLTEKIKSIEKAHPIASKVVKGTVRAASMGGALHFLE